MILVALALTLVAVVGDREAGSRRATRLWLLDRRKTQFKLEWF
jgi:hypothetical protein